jgi:hypothetical protein
VGLSFLAVFDLLNYFLVGIVFLALAARLWLVNKSLAAYISLTMFALSQRYAVATSASQKTDLLAAGQSILAGNDPLASIPGTGALVSLLLVVMAGILFSLVLLPSHHTTGISCLLAGGCDLAYCLVFPLTPLAPVYLLLAVAGLFWMLWHLLITRFLFQRLQEA